MQLRPIIFLLIISFAQAITIAQNKQGYKFDHLTSSTGFPVDFVHSIEQDKHGFIWALTQNSLMRYNGHSGKFYTHTGDSLGLLPLTSYQLHQTKNGNFWISYQEGGMSLFDPQKETFRHFIHDENNPLSFPDAIGASVMEDSKGNTWIGTWGGGLLKFNSSDGTFNQYYPVDNNPKFQESCSILGLTEDSDGTFLAFTWEGARLDNFIYVFDYQKKSFTKLSLDGYSFENKVEQGKIQDAFRIVHFIEVDKHNNLWIGTFTGLFYMDRTAKTITRVTGLDKSLLYVKGHITFDNATALLYENENTLWVSTEVGGIMVIDVNTHEVNYLNKIVENPSSLSGNIIRDMLRDHYGNIWIATEGGGLDIYSPFLQQFKVVSNDVLQATRQNTAQGVFAVNHHFVNSTNTEIFVSHGKGFSIYNIETGRSRRIDLQSEFEKFQAKNPSYQEYDHNNINFVGHAQQIKSGYMIGTHLGLIYFNPQTNTCDFSEIKNYGRLCLDQYDGDEWHYGFKFTHFDDGTINPDFFNYNTDTREKHNIAPLPQDLNTGESFNYHITQKLDSTTVYLDFSANTFLIYNALNHDYVTYSSRSPFNNFPDSNQRLLYTQPDGLMWMLTQNGLYSFDYKTGKTTNIKPYLELGENDRIRSLCQDEEGKLWIALRTDLIRFDPLTKEKYRFTQNHGLVIGGFVPTMLATNNWHKLSFPVNYGLLIIDPKKLEFTSSPSHMILSAIVIGKDTLNNLRLSEFVQTEKVLNWDENFITIEFASNKLFSPGGKTYEYRLIGLDSAWVQAGSQNKITYTNLKSGNYQFEARCTDSFGTMSDTLRVPFKIDKPFWLKWWFILLEVILFISAIMIYIRLRERKLTLAKRRLELAVDVRTKEVREKVKEIAMQNNLIQTKNKELTDSIKYAERIQSTLLAHRTVLEKNLSQPMVFFKPKDIVSGDFYWAAKQEDNFYLAICDSTGHGVPGAFMSLLNIRFLNEAIAEKNISAPNEIFNHVRNRLIESVSHDGAKDGMDGTLLSFNKTTNKLCYASAQNAPILIRDNKITKLGADKMPIGLGENISPFTLHNIEPQKGDCYYFYTDGFKDQFGGPKGKKLKNKNLVALLLSIHQLPAKEQEKKLDEFLTEWMGELEQVDDILVVGIRV